MKDDDDKPLAGDEEKPSEQRNNLDANVNPETNLPEKFENKLSADEIVDRAFESLQLFKEAEDLVKKDLERKQKKRKETFELQSGESRTLESYTITQDPTPYIALFGKDIPFFKYMFTICDIDDKWNPNDWEKPPIAGILINELIYRRFGGKAIVAALRSKVYRDGHRRYKFSQFFDSDAKTKIIEFRNDAIEMMKEFKRGELYHFRRAYAKKYRVEGFQFQLDI